MQAALITDAIREVLISRILIVLIYFSAFIGHVFQDVTESVSPPDETCTPRICEIRVSSDFITHHDMEAYR
jgi:hypothetical protein